MTCRYRTIASLCQGGELTVAAMKNVGDPFSKRKKDGRGYFVFNQRELKLFALRWAAAQSWKSMKRRFSFAK
jgi:hypothetical protein